MKKVLFILKQRMSYGSYGISYGLINSAKFVAQELSKLSNVQCKIVEVIDNNCIDKEASLYKPDIIILEALWVTPSKMPVLMKLHPNVEWIVRLHSKPSFIAMEGIAMDWIGKYIDIGKESGKLFVSANNKEFCDYLSSIYKAKIPYTPNIYPDVFRHNPRKPVGKTLDIACMGALRPLKNHLPQAISAISFAEKLGKKLNFHINSDRVEQKGEVVLKNLRNLFQDTPNTQLVEHPWVNHSDFLDLLRTMDLGMQVSLSETFNIVACDLVSLGIPVLVSKDIDWAPNIYVAEATSLESIEKGLARIYALDNALITNWAKYNLYKHNQKALADWKKVIF